METTMLNFVAADLQSKATLAKIQAHIAEGILKSSLPSLLISRYKAFAME